jgi:hypothetical protein
MAEKLKKLKNWGKNTPIINQSEESILMLFI